NENIIISNKRLNVSLQENSIDDLIRTKLIDKAISTANIVVNIEPIPPNCSISKVLNKIFTVNPTTTPTTPKPCCLIPCNMAAPTEYTAKSNATGANHDK